VKEYINTILNQYQTPLYVFDINQLEKRVQYLKEHLPSRVTLCYAMKANPFLIKELENMIDKFEVCSPGEYFICEEMNIDPLHLVISGVYKTPEVIETMFNKNVEVYTIESLTQLSLLQQLTKKYQKSVKVLLRLTSGNQFGMNKDEIIDIIKNRYDDEFIHIKGIQYFSGTQKTSLKRLNKECQMIDEFLLELQQYNYEVEELEFGPGFPVTYFEGGKEFDEDDFMRQFSDILNAMQYQGKLTFELGRSIVANCGYYLTSVVDMKENQNGHYAILDGGMHHMAYYGQMMAMKHPYHFIYPYRENHDPVMWNLCGSLCTINDLIVKQLPVTDLKIGDTFVFKNTGAYSMTEGISLFLSRDLPQIIFLKDGECELVRDIVDTYHLNLAHYERRR